MTDWTKHRDHLAMVAVVSRYKERFLAVHGTTAPGTVEDYQADYKMYGDIIEPNVLNAWNNEAVEQYVQLYINQVIADGTVENALLVLGPVMAGLFEHSFLMGYMYAAEGDG